MDCRRCGEHGVSSSSAPGTPMTLNQLRCLVAIVESGFVISPAAKRVHATQSGLSKQIRQIELEQGEPVSERRDNNLCDLAACGLRVIEHARAVMAEMGAMRSLTYWPLKRGEGCASHG